jgi:hypothetical protein
MFLGLHWLGEAKINIMHFRTVFGVSIWPPEGMPTAGACVLKRVTHVHLLIILSKILIKLTTYFTRLCALLGGAVG